MAKYYETRPGALLWARLRNTVISGYAKFKERRRTENLSWNAKINFFYDPARDIINEAKGKIVAYPQLKFSHKVKVDLKRWQRYEHETEGYVTDDIVLAVVNSIEEYKLLKLAYCPHDFPKREDGSHIWFCPSWLTASSYRWVSGMKPETVHRYKNLVFPQLFIIFPYNKNNCFSRFRGLACDGQGSGVGAGLGYIENFDKARNISEQYGSVMNYIRQYYVTTAMRLNNKGFVFDAAYLNFDKLTEKMIKTFINVHVNKVRKHAAKQRAISGASKALW